MSSLAVIFIFLLSYSPVAISDKEYTSQASTCYNECKNSTSECFKNSYCDNSTCTCFKYYQYDEKCDCVQCPGLDEKCDRCCSAQSLVCVNNICSQCDISSGNSCITNTQHDVLLTATQIAMTGALILGIITVLALLWKLCRKNDYRSPRSRRQNARSRTSGISVDSGDSLQRAVAERLRDAPPPYSRHHVLPPPGDNPPPYCLRGYVNATFEGDLNIPPPAYSAAVNESIDTTATDENEEDKIETVATAHAMVKQSDTVSDSISIHM